MAKNPYNATYHLKKPTGAPNSRFGTAPYPISFVNVSSMSSSGAMTTSQGDSLIPRAWSFFRKARARKLELES